MIASSDLTDAIDALPNAPRSKMAALRSLIHETAKNRNIPLTEALKWGQPSFAPPKRLGTPIRLGWSKKAPDRIDLLVHCQTTLVSDWRALFPELAYAGTRALQIPLQDPLNKPALKMIIASALTYRQTTKASI